MIGLAALAALCVGAARACGLRAPGALLGAGLFAALSWGGLLATGRLDAWWVDALGIAAGIALGLFFAKAPELPTLDAVPPPLPARASALPRAALLVAALFAAALFAAAIWSRPDGGWDAMLIWNLRARLLTAAAPLSAAFDPRLVHTDYPPLVSLLCARLGSPALVALAFAVLAALALWELARESAGPDAAALVTALLLATPLFAGISAAQYADVPLAAFVLVAAGFASRERAHSDGHGEMLFAGLAAGLAVFTKNDGALELACLALAVLVARPRQLALFALGTLPAFAAVASFKLSRWPQANELVAGWTSHALLARIRDLSRWREIAKADALALVRPLEWGIGPLFAFASLALKRPRERLLALFLAATLAALFLVYLSTPYPLAWHLETSLDRVLLQLWPTALLLLARSLDARRRIGYTPAAH